MTATLFDILTDYGIDIGLADRRAEKAEELERDGVTPAQLASVCEWLESELGDDPGRLASILCFRIANRKIIETANDVDRLKAARDKRGVGKKRAGQIEHYQNMPLGWHSCGCPECVAYREKHP